MPDAADDAFATFLAHERDELLQLAALLEDDRIDAGQLVRSALLAVARRRRPAEGDPATAARTALVRRAVTPHRSDGQQLGWAPGEARGRYTGEQDALHRTLTRMPPPRRAAVVLSCWAGLPDGEIAAILRTTEELVRAEVSAAAAALRTALVPAAAPWRASGSVPAPCAEGNLRDVLAGLARRAASWAPDAPTAAELWAEVGRRRRLRWWQTAGAVACAAVIVTVPTMTDEGRPPVDPAAASPERPSAPPPFVDVRALQPRGSLADDAAFLAGLRQLSWTDEAITGFPTELTTAPESRRVLFAGDVPGARWALLVGRSELLGESEVGMPAPPPDELSMAWFIGPPGAAPEEMRLGSYPYGISHGMAPSLLDPRSGTLVVVPEPGDVVEVSPRVDVGSDGTDSRTWTAMQTVDGIATARLDPVDLPWTWSVQFRVLRDGEEVFSGTPDVVLVPFDQRLPSLDIDFPGGAPSDEGRTAAQHAAYSVLAGLGLSPADVRTTAPVVTPVPAPAGGTIAVVTVRLPSGAAVVSAQWAVTTPDGIQGGMDCGMDVRPAGPAPEDGVLAAACELFDHVTGRTLDEVLVISAPPSVASVRMYGGDRAFVGEHPMPDGGVLLVPRPDGLREIEAVTDGGVLLGRTEPLGRWTPTG